MRALALGLIVLAGCGTARSFVASPGPYDRVPEAWLEPLRDARVAFERGELVAALELVRPRAEQRPEVLPVRLFLQEIELALLAREGTLGELRATGPAEARAALFAREDREADRQPRAEGYVLAARLAPDAATAQALLLEADTIDPRCVWVAYARAWWFLRARDFKPARERLVQALSLDPGHLPSMRLSATLSAGAGDYEPAAVALEVWLERTAGDPLTSAAERADALLDLAAVRVLLGESEDALDLFESLDPRALRDPVRVETVRAAALAASGEPREALAATERAIGLGPDRLLPLVQTALLHQRAGRVEEERKTWQRLLELTAGPAGPGSDDPAAIDFEAALFRLQALTRLARLENGT